MFQPRQVLQFSRLYASKVVSKSKVTAAAKEATLEKHKVGASSSKHSTDDIFKISKPLDNKKLQFTSPRAATGGSVPPPTGSANAFKSSSSSSSSSKSGSSKSSSHWLYYLLMFGAGSVCAVYFPPIAILQQVLNKDLPSSTKINSSSASRNATQTISDFSNDQEVQQYIANLQAEMEDLPAVTNLKSNSAYVCYKGWNEPESSILQTSLSLPGGFTVPPLFFENRATGDSVTVLHVGAKLCGYPFIIHGGILATILDECFKRTVVTSLDNKKRTDKDNHDELQSVDLKLKYSNPTIANNFIVVKCNILDEFPCGYSVKGTIETPEGKLLVTGISDLQVGSCVAGNQGFTTWLKGWVSSFWKPF